MCSCDNEPPSVYDKQTVKARKSHRCDECRGMIAAGENYRRIWGVWDGTHLVFKECSDCTDLIAWAQDRDDCLCLSHGDAHEIIVESMRESGEAEWYAEAKSRVRTIRSKRRQPIAA